MNEKSVKVFADDETVRRVEIAARKRNMPINTYWLTAVQHELEKDGIDDTDHQVQVDELIEKIRELQARILKERNGQPVDVDTLLDDLREERDEESLGLR